MAIVTETSNEAVMGKKSRAKRKESPSTVKKTVAVPNMAPRELSQPTLLGERLAQPSKRRASATDIEDYTYIRHDIRRTLWILGAIASLLAVAVIVDANTGVLTRAGAAMARAFGLQ